MPTDEAIVLGALLPIAIGMAWYLISVAWRKVRAWRNPALIRQYGTGWLPVVLGMGVFYWGWQSQRIWWSLPVQSRLKKPPANFSSR